MNLAQKVVLLFGLFFAGLNAAIPSHQNGGRYCVFDPGPRVAAVDVGALLAQTLAIGLGALALMVAIGLFPESPPSLFPDSAPSPPAAKEPTGPQFPAFCEAGMPPEPEWQLVEESATHLVGQGEPEEPSATNSLRPKRPLKDSSTSNRWEPFADLDGTQGVS